MQPDILILFSWDILFAQIVLQLRVNSSNPAEDFETIEESLLSKQSKPNILLRNVFSV